MQGIKSVSFLPFRNSFIQITAKNTTRPYTTTCANTPFGLHSTKNKGIKSSFFRLLLKAAGSSLVLRLPRRFYFFQGLGERQGCLLFHRNIVRLAVFYYVLMGLLP